MALAPQYRLAGDGHRFLSYPAGHAPVRRFAGPQRIVALFP